MSKSRQRMKYEAIINGDQVVEVDESTQNALDLQEIHPDLIHILQDQKSHSFKLVSISLRDKTVKLRQNEGRIIEIKLKNELDLLIDKLGFNERRQKLITELNSPMPGLVLEVRVKEGEEVKEGDPLLIIEAMKMENIIKSPQNAVVGEVCVDAAQSVEKGMTLIKFKADD